LEELKEKYQKGHTVFTMALDFIPPTRIICAHGILVALLVEAKQAG
jgi:hypothetical protein